MELKQRIKFCRICKNADHTIEKGVLCSITNKKPTFKERCPEFIPVSAEVEIPDFTPKKPDPAELYIESISSLWRTRVYEISSFHNNSYSEGQLSKLPAKYTFTYSNENAQIKIALGVIFSLSALYAIISLVSITVYAIPILLFGLYLLHNGFKKLNKTDAETYFTKEKIYTPKNQPVFWRDIEYILDIDASIDSVSKFAGVKIWGQKKPIELFLVNDYNFKNTDVFEVMEMYRCQASGNR